MIWATAADLRFTATDLGVAVAGDDAALERLILRAQDDLEAHALGARVTDMQWTTLAPEQQEALARAACLQACWIAELSSEYLGPDGLAAADGVAFSRDPRPPVSRAAMAPLSMRGLVARSGTVAPDPPDVLA